MIIYVAGAFSGADSWEIERNIHRAEEVGAALFRMNVVPLIPHSMYRHFSTLVTYAAALDATLKLLRRCDGMVVVPCSEKSKGTRGEIQVANAMRMPVFFWHPDDMRRPVDALTFNEFVAQAHHYAQGREIDTTRLDEAVARIESQREAWIAHAAALGSYFAGVEQRKLTTRQREAYTAVEDECARRRASFNDLAFHKKGS